jgi:hypothetical protein
MEQHHQQQLAPGPETQGETDDPVPDVEGSAMLEGVILPAFDNVRPPPSDQMRMMANECHRSDRGSLMPKLGGYWRDVGMRL